VSAYFTINFRREAYQREVARTRRRLFTLGAWVAYFGALGMVLGLYGLNYASLAHRTRLMEREVSRLRALGAQRAWQVPPEQLAVVQQFKANPQAWRDRLSRLGTLLPSGVILTSIAVNPDDLPADRNKLVLGGEYRATAGTDRMRPVVQLVTTLRADSVFSRDYTNIRLASSQTLDAPSNVTAFVIECR
jgi:hypothetical protein